MDEVQRYANGKERPVLWSVYNEMHKRAATAEGELKQLRADRGAVLNEAVREVGNFTQETAGTDMTTAKGLWYAGLDAGVRKLRRMADAEQQPSTDASRARAHHRRLISKLKSRLSVVANVRGDAIRAAHRFERLAREILGDRDGSLDVTDNDQLGRRAPSLSTSRVPGKSVCSGLLVNDRDVVPANSTGPARLEHHRRAWTRQSLTQPA
ncbi:hypothetical protein [Streptomyces sp. NBC_00063]|uniref:hypothetical protein n=1 Tax=Streptomyces sp. NBC_00063 TaxID=2975638 RepID=UPI003D75E989